MENACKAKNKVFDVYWWKLWLKAYGQRRNQHITYAMHQVAGALEALATARAAALRTPPKFALYRRAERELRW